MLLRESPSIFKLWASGRRACTGALLTFYLRQRQDLVQWALELVQGQRDVLDVEVQPPGGGGGALPRGGASSRPAVCSLLAAGGWRTLLARERLRASLLSGLPPLLPRARCTCLRAAARHWRSQWRRRLWRASWALSWQTSRS